MGFDFKLVIWLKSQKVDIGVDGILILILNRFSDNFILDFFENSNPWKVLVQRDTQNLETKLECSRNETKMLVKARNHYTKISLLFLMTLYITAFYFIENNFCLKLSGNGFEPSLLVVQIKQIK